MAYETILTDVDDGILTITLNRPERMNAWTYQMSAELQAAVADGNADDDVEAFVFTGAGRGFCAGADVQDVFKARSENTLESRGDNRAISWVDLVRESKPMVAAVNGATIGLGLTQILPMDYIVASTAAKLSCRFVKMGVVPELASSRFLMQRVGFGHASELMLSGRTVEAEEALALGLVDAVVEPEDLLTEAQRIAKSMGENPQEALRMIKQLVTQNAVEADIATVQRRESTFPITDCYKPREHLRCR